jgi:hypothetical protein
MKTGSISPYAMRDYQKRAGGRYACVRYAPALGDVHVSSRKPTIWGCFIQRGSSRLVTASADPAHAHQFRRVCDAGPSSRGARRRFTICKSNPAYNPSFLATYCLLETGIPNRRACDVVTRPANGGKTLVVMPAPHRSGVLDERRLRYRQTPVNMRRAAALRRLTANAAARRSTRIGQHGTPQL